MPILRRPDPALALVAVVAVAIAADPRSTAHAGQHADGLYAEITTSRGTIAIRLEPDMAPMTVAGFVGLAEGTIANRAHPTGVPLYDGAVFHRVVPGHVIQAGMAPADCSCGLGFDYPNEIHADLSHDHPGAVGIPNGGPHTNGAGFYITLGDRSYLDGDYTVFGEVVDGLDVVMAIQADDTVGRVEIVRIGAVAEAYRPDTATFRRLVAEARQRVEAQRVARVLAEQAWIDSQWPGLEGAAIEVRQRQLQAGQTGQTGPAARARYRGVALRYRGHIIGHAGQPIDQVAFASDSAGDPTAGDSAQEFDPTSTSAQLPDALRAALRQLQPGERRVVVLPPWLAYGSGGYYSPAVQDAERFVISPGTTLVYEIEASSTP